MSCKISLPFIPSIVKTALFRRGEKEHRKRQIPKGREYQGRKRKEREKERKGRGKIEDERERQRKRKT